MGLFSLVEGAACVLRRDGVFRQVDLFRRGTLLFAKYGSGYIGLKASCNSTTHPKMFWDHIEGVRYDGNGPFGALRVTENT